MELLEIHEYQSLKHLEGATVEVERITHFDHMPDGKVTVIKDYPKGLLIDME